MTKHAYGTAMVNMVALEAMIRADVTKMREAGKASPHDEGYLNAQIACDEAMIQWGLALNTLNNLIAKGDITAQDALQAAGLQMGGMLVNAMTAAVSANVTDNFENGFHMGQMLAAAFTKTTMPSAENEGGAAATDIPYVEDAN